MDILENNNQTENTYKVPAVEQAIRVMLCLADNGSTPKSLTNICKEVGIHRSKAFSILNTLNEYGFVRKNQNRKGYVLGPGLLTLTGIILEDLSLSRLVEGVLSDLAKKVGATVGLGVISDDKCYRIAQYHGAPGIGIYAPIGYVTSITYGAHGKAIAAFLPEDELEELLKNKNLFFHGSPDRYSRTRLNRELEQCRRNGFALDLGEMMPGVNAIAFPVLDQNGNPIGYITIVGFFSKEEVQRIGPLAADVLKGISKEAGHLIFWQRINSRKSLA